jgi:putative transport protein
MLLWLEQFLVRYPELTLFLVIAAGYWIGAFKIGAFSLGPVTGALFAGLLVGQFAVVPVSGMTKSFLFLLFLFGIGYSVGPQFMQSLKRDGLKPVLLALVVCFTGVAASILIAKALGLDAGFAAGLLSGALTQSAAMGTATDAVNGLMLSEPDRARLVAHIAVADAVCYIFGYAGVILFLTVIAPALLKIDLKTEALKLEQELGMTRAKPGLASAWRKFDLRAYRLVDGSPLAGLTVAASAPSNRSATSRRGGWPWCWRHPTSRPGLASSPAANWGARSPRTGKPDSSRWKVSNGRGRLPLRLAARRRSRSRKFLSRAM